MHQTAPRRRRAAGGRWSAWARALAGRHARILGLRRDAAMTLIAARPRAGARANTHISLAVHPQIHLAARLATAPKAAAPVKDDRDLRTANVIWYGTVRPGTSIRLSASRTASPAIDTRPRGAAPRLPARAPAAPALTAPSATAAESKPRRMEVVAAASVRTVRQIARSHRRVEDRLSWQRRSVARGPDGEPLVLPAALARRVQPSLPPTRLHPQRPPMILAAPPRPAADQPSPAPATERTRPVPARPAEVDLQSLTDQVVRQIDRRIVAHRERMGRI